MWRKRWATNGVRWLQLAFAVVLVTSIWSLTLHQLAESRRIQLDLAQRDAKMLSRLFSEHASRTVEVVDQSIIFLRHQYASRGANFDVMNVLRHGLGRNDYIYNQFIVINEQSEVVLSNLPFTSVNVADRDYYAFHKGSNNDAIHISKPMLGRVSQRWIIMLTRRMNDRQDRFNGVVAASVDPQYFLNLYHDIDVGRQGSVALVGADGVMRVRSVGNDASLGQDISNSRLFNGMQTARTGMFTEVSPIDGRERIYAFERLERVPLFVLVGIDLEERMAVYALDRQRVINMASAATAAIAIFSIVLQWLIGQLTKSHAGAVAASLAKSRFLANMSHELRTPLNGILGYSELLQYESADQRTGNFASAIHLSGVRLLRLVEAILELSALEAGRVQLDIEMFAPSTLPALALAAHREAAQAKGLVLSSHTAPDLPALWHGDIRKLLRVINILLDNAVSVTISGGISVHVLPTKQGKLRVEVQDSGPGIPKELRQKIFEKFLQLDDSATRNKEGAGLGLSIASRLVSLMNGRIWVADAGERGATFVVELPSAPAPRPDMPA